LANKFKLTVLIIAQQVVILNIILTNEQFVGPKANQRDDVVSCMNHSHMNYSSYP